jgi:CheY-like chemotaxis protein
MSDSQKKVIIVEDDLILNLLFESYMEKLGFDTRGELVYGKTAVDMARELKPDLVLMDITLEGDMDGIDAMTEIRKFSDVPVIYITGNSDPVNRERAIPTKFLEYLIKPIEFEDLRQVIHKHFQGNW